MYFQYRFLVLAICLLGLPACSDDWSLSHELSGTWIHVERKEGVSIEQQLFVDSDLVENKELGENEFSYHWDYYIDNIKNEDLSHAGKVRIIKKDFQAVFQPSVETKDTLIFQFRLGLSGGSVVFSADGITALDFYKTEGGI